MKKNAPTILILGAKGMLGHTVYHLLKDTYPHSVFGTSHKKEAQLFFLSVKTAKKDFASIREDIGHIDYVINCIGITQNCENMQELILVNALFPHILSELAEKHQFFLFHISTDAVFPKNAKDVNEFSPTSPETAYGASKVLGEVQSPRTITIRTSIIGVNPYSQKGLLEWALFCSHHPKEFQLQGFSNHSWSGGTTLQLAEFLGKVIDQNVFKKITEKSSLLHFAPLGPLSKYEILRTFITEIKSRISVKKVEESYTVTRYLTTMYPRLLFGTYTNDIQIAIAQLLSFEKNHGYNIIIQK